MPPPSPMPGWANGDVCSESIATRLGDIRRLILVTDLGPIFWAAHGAVEVDPHLLLAVVEVGRGADGVLQVRRRGRFLAVTRVEDPGPDVEALGRDSEATGDLLEDVGARLAQPALDLAEVRVRDPGSVAQAPQGEAGVLPLLANELPEVAEPLLDAVGHAPLRGGQAVTCRRARSASITSITPWRSRRRSE